MPEVTCWRSSRLALLLLFALAWQPLGAEAVNPSLQPIAGGPTGAEELNAEERALLQRKGRITMCVDPDWLPLEKIEAGKHIGIAADYMRLMEQYLGVPVLLVPSKTWNESVALA